MTNMDKTHTHHAENSHVPKNERDELWIRINNILEGNELWKDSDLTLSMLSRLVYSNRTYVAQSFKENSGMRFIEYLKHKRIDYVVSQLSKNPNLNIKNLCFDAGYRSYPTAWRQFKDVKGMSPAEYVSSVENE